MQDLSRNSNSPKAPTIKCLRRQGPLLQWAFCLCLLVFGALIRQTMAASGVADPNNPRETDTQRELSQRLEDLIRQLRQERSAYYLQKAQYEGRMEKARENHKILQDELEDLSRQEAETDQQNRRYEAEVEDLKKELVSRASLEAAIRKHIEPFIVNQRMAIGNGIPYKQQERIARLEAARGDPSLVRGQAPPGKAGIKASSRDSATDRLGHVWNYGQEELRLARSSETYTARAKTVDESSPHARFFRVGRKILGYITEDGRQSAMWLSLPDHQDWLFITDASQSAHIRSAVEILDRRQGPRLVTLPVALWPRSLAKGGTDASP
jgi:uncharacterized protein YlxW (UPF0749 family)